MQEKRRRIHFADTGRLVVRSMFALQESKFYSSGAGGRVVDATQFVIDRSLLHFRSIYEAWRSVSLMDCGALLLCNWLWGRDIRACLSTAGCGRESGSGLPQSKGED